MIESLDAFPHRRRSLVFTSGNRRDADVVAMGRLIGDGFDRVLLYADYGHSDRAEGELNALLRRGIAAGKRVSETVEVPGEMAAIEAALADLQPGDLLVLGVESIEEALAFVQARLSV